MKCKKSQLVSLAVFCTYIILSFAQDEDIRLPPMVTVNAKSEMVYKEADTITLQCEATGIPTPTYVWHKNGTLVEISGDVSQPNPEVGTIQISNANRYRDDGFYQCTASNKYGAALSPMSNVKQAVVVYNTDNTAKIKAANQGDSLVLEPYNTISSYPSPLFSWKTVTDPATNTDPRQVVTSKRIALDSQAGTLYFANLVVSDSGAGTDGSGSRAYKLDVRNAIEDVVRGGSPYQIEVTAQTVTARTPNLMFPSSSGYTITALKGQNATLKCFFGGYPTPDVIWTLPPSPPPATRIDCTQEYNTECFIRNLAYSDQATYTCTGKNSAGSVQATINLVVQSIPTFTNSPNSQNVTVGQRASFLCSADAVPTATIEWYSNGAKIDPSDPGYSRLIISEDRTNLTVIKVCKDCDGTPSTDLQVFMCVITNKHGSAYASAYLNVIEPTLIYDTGDTVDVELDPEVEGPLVANFTCRARTDPIAQNTLVISWWFKQQRLYSGGVYKLQNNDENLVVNLTNADDISTYLGDYECLAYTSYSQAKQAYTLNVKGYQPATSTAGIGDFWWVFLLIFLLLLLTILCICCVMYMQRNKGEDYPVDEKERENGNDPVEECKESGFHDYQRPLEVTTLKGSRASLGSSRKLESDDDDMADMYGYDNDAGKFSEDGSFINNYNTGYNAGYRPTITVPQHAVSNA